MNDDWKRRPDLDREDGMSDKPILKNIHPNLSEYDGGVAYFIVPYGFCCENPWDYITNNGERPEYWEEYDNDYEAIEYFLKDRGWMDILNRDKELQAEIKELKRKLNLVNDHAESCAIFVMDDKDCNCFYGKIGGEE